MPRRTSVIQDFYDRLFAKFGPQHWWPGDTDVEIVVGAILTQNTNWKNVEYAISNLKQADALSWTALRDIDDLELSELIRPAGYYNVKRKRLKHFVQWLWSSHDGDMTPLRQMPLESARSELLSINGIGPETADSILLYALDRPVFVIDAYTSRVLRRHNLADGKSRYADIQTTFQDALSSDAKMFNEYHALIVRLAKEHCRVRANCADCPLAYHTHNEQLR